MTGAQIRLPMTARRAAAQALARLPQLLACCGRAARHGHPQRHAGFLLRRRPVHRSRRRASRMRAQMIEEGADIIDIGAESTRPYGGAKPVTLEEELARLQPVLPAVVAARPAGLDRHHQGRRSPPGRSARAPRIVNDVWGLQRDPNMAPRGRPSTACRSSSCTTATRPSPRINIVADINAFFARSLDIAGAGRHRARRDRARSRHRLRQDARSRAWSAIAQACRIQALRPADPGRRLAQALHQFRSRRREPIERIGGSIAAHVMAVDATAPRSSAPTTWPRPCRRCASPPPSGTRK